MSARPDTRDTVNALARIIQAASRLTAEIHRTERLRDVDDEVNHMRANLDFIDKQVTP